MKYFALLALLLTFFAPSAHAQGTPADEARAQILKAQLEGFLENQQAMAVKNNCKMDLKGGVTVEKANGYYAFTTPHITYTDAKGIRSELGMVALNAVPQTNNEWKITLALPTPISSYNQAGREEFRTSIGGQNAVGIWNEKLGHFTSMNGKYSNVQMNNLIEQHTVTVGALTYESVMTEKDPEAYTGSGRATLDNISFFDPETTFKGILPKIVLDTNLADRAAKSPMTKEQVKARPQATYPDFFNIFSQLFGTPERVNAKVTGLDGLSSQLQQAMITAPAQNRAWFLQGILGVSAINGMGKPVSGDNATKSYDVVFGQNGSVTVNGTDFGSLVQTLEQPRKK
ncbi:MAG: hypothetical protein DI626_02115 [Micavibrio aeruginosavorus]|uniref:DUF945 domain-containing protein n=1 Tax=Micavibrio aeruginosavorus TaxID=349221 RepID=A0A2W5A730_9BACT|nr:MAG: hypothetical protein DI626_02115 [Micavibrio aeruginosavorus]